MSNLFQQNQEKLSQEISKQSPMSVQGFQEQTKRLLKREKPEKTEEKIS